MELDHTFCPDQVINCVHRSVGGAPDPIIWLSEDLVLMTPGSSLRLFQRHRLDTQRTFKAIYNSSPKEAYTRETMKSTFISRPGQSKSHMSATQRQEIEMLRPETLWRVQ